MTLGLTESLKYNVSDLRLTNNTGFPVPYCFPFTALLSIGPGSVKMKPIDASRS